MPKEGFNAITIPEHLDQRISTVVEQSKGIIQNKTQALTHAWHLYENLLVKEKDPRPVHIAHKSISHNHPVFVIAEIGINHNGSMDVCKKLIDAAVNAGCDAVKFQKRTIDIVYTPEELAKPRDHPFGTTNGDLKRRLEFGEDEFREIDRHCKARGILWFASPWDIPSVEFLEKFNVPCYKIASACLTDRDLLLRMKATGKPIILSTGMSTMEEILKAVNLLGEDNLIIMHTVSTYPCPDEDCNLGLIQHYRKFFNCPIGYSGHEVGITPTILAVGMGACVIERHITLERGMFGSDQAASLAPDGLERVVRGARLARNALGFGRKFVLESEKPIQNKLRRVNTFS